MLSPWAPLYNGTTTVFLRALLCGGKGMSVIRVFIADDHPVVRNGLVMQLNQSESIEVVGDTGDGHKILPLVRKSAPDVLILDAVMPNVRTGDIIRRLKSHYPTIKVIVFSAYEDPALVRGLLSAGADGYMLKEEMLTRVVDAVHEVMQGGLPLSSRVAAAMRGIWTDHPHTELHPVENLTSREQEVLQWMVQGLSNRAIAEKLHVTERTVKFHVGNILSKLGARTRVEAVRVALEKGLVEK